MAFHLTMLASLPVLSGIAYLVLRKPRCAVWVPADGKKRLAAIIVAGQLQ